MRVHRKLMNQTRTISMFLACPPVLAFVVAQACSTEMTPQGPSEPELVSSGALELTVGVTGTRPDIDGYDVAITLAAQAGPLVSPIGPAGGTLQFPELPLGTHVLRIEGLANPCQVMGNHPRAFTIRPGATTRLEVSISCPGPGALLVKTLSTGRDIGSTGYSVVIESGSGSLEASIGIRDSLFVEEEDLPPGSNWSVRLDGAPDNCQVISQNPRVLGRLRGATVRVEFTIVCIERFSRIAYASGGDIFITDGSEAVNISSDPEDFFFLPGDDRAPSLSPDRSRVVFSSDRDEPGMAGFDLYVVNAGGGGLRRLTHGPGNAFVGSQAWSPDGSRIVFSMTDGATFGASDIYVMNANGTGIVRLTFDGEDNIEPAWSPDGNSIAFCSTRGQRQFHPMDRQAQVFRMTIDGGGIIRLADAGCSPAWSPDGSKIAFTAYTIGNSDLAVVGVDGSGFTTLHPASMTSHTSSRRPSWAPDGSQIAFEMGALASRIAIVGFDGNAFDEALLYRFGNSPSWR